MLKSTKKICSTYKSNKTYYYILLIQIKPYKDKNSIKR